MRAGAPCNQLTRGPDRTGAARHGAERRGSARRGLGGTDEPGPGVLFTMQISPWFRPVSRKPINTGDELSCRGAPRRCVRPISLILSPCCRACPPVPSITASCLPFLPRHPSTTQRASRPRCSLHHTTSNAPNFVTGRAVCASPQSAAQGVCPRRHGEAGPSHRPRMHSQRAPASGEPRRFEYPYCGDWGRVCNPRTLTKGRAASAPPCCSLWLWWSLRSHGNTDRPMESSVPARRQPLSMISVLTPESSSTRRRLNGPDMQPDPVPLFLVLKDCSRSGRH